MTSVPRCPPYEGPALFSYGFRPFFLFGALFSAAAVPVWLAAFVGEITIPTAFSSRDWHVHEMLYGYVSAVVTGFLLTAIPNWTGRLPLNGTPLAILFALWLAGRAAVAFSDVIGWQAGLLVDASFLLVVIAAAVREIVAGRNWRNLKVLVLITLLAIGNIAFHIEAHVAGTANYAGRGALAIIIVLISLIGGRVVPSFTHNWLARENPGPLPSALNRFDIGIVLVTAVALASWTAWPDVTPVAWALITVGMLQAIRLARWTGHRTWREPLVLILHVGYAFVPMGLILVGLGSFNTVAPSAGVHALGAGAVGTMTLAVMTRASLGHTGRTLHASRVTQAIYAAVIVAAYVRIIAALAPSATVPLLCLAGALWTGAFLGFGVSYGPILNSRRAA